MNGQSLLIVFSTLTLYFVKCSSERNFLNTHPSIRALALSEAPIYNSLKNCDIRQPDLEGTLQRYLNDYETSTGLVRESETNVPYEFIIADHPLLSFRLIHRFANDLKIILNHLDPRVNDTLQASIRNVEESTGWPGKSAFETTMDAILRIHHIYDANITEFARGIIFGDDTKYGLRYGHCFHIATYALVESHYAHAIEWFEVAKELISEEEKDPSFDAEALDNWIKYAIVVHDDLFDKTYAGDPLFFVQKVEDTNKYDLPRIKRRNQMREVWKGHRAQNFNDINFWSLCSGDDLRAEEEKSQLYCWYERNSNPAWAISPLKIEQLANIPYLIQIYEALTDRQIEKLVKQAEPTLNVAALYAADKVGADNPEGTSVTKQRTASNTWIVESEKPHLKEIPTIIELMTGLSVVPTKSAEAIQIASYTFGGHYSVHQDALKILNGDWQIQIGDRIATFMAYLSDVQKGGYTAFPQAGIAARPVKGSAVFWYNLMRNGEPDENSSHGACPVILGSKWVANKWIRVNNQFLKRPCTLNPGE